MRTFLINKKNLFTQKRYLVKFNCIKMVFVTHKAETKKLKITKTYLNETIFETRSDKSAFANIILELPLTNAIDHTLTFIH